MGEKERKGGAGVLSPRELCLDGCWDRLKFSFEVLQDSGWGASEVENSELHAVLSNYTRAERSDIPIHSVNGLTMTS